MPSSRTVLAEWGNTPGAKRATPRFGARDAFVSEIGLEFCSPRRAGTHSPVWMGGRRGSAWDARVWGLWAMMAMSRARWPDGVMALKQRERRPLERDSPSILVSVFVDLFHLYQTLVSPLWERTIKRRWLGLHSGRVPSGRCRSRGSSKGS